jgi:phospholipid/cholesterol/gamma-HCH transport system permease protein
VEFRRVTAPFGQDSAAARLGARPRRIVEEIGFAVAILIETFAILARGLVGRGHWRVRAVLDEMIEIGLRPFPVLALLAVLVGLTVSLAAGRALARVSVEDLLLSTLILAIVREFVPLLAGILIAGRSGVALAVRIGTMAMQHEVDALVVMGMSPVRYIVVPALVAMTAMLLCLTLWAAALGLAASAIYFQVYHGIPFARFIDQCETVITPAVVVATVGKSVLSAVLIALIAAVQGSRVAGGPDDLSRAARRTIVQSLIAVIVIAFLFSFVD